MRAIGAIVLVLMLAVIFSLLDVYGGIDIPMSIRFLTMHIVAVLTIELCDR